MPPYERHVFVCENSRDPDHPRGCCASKDSNELRRRLKAAVIQAGLKAKVRINKAGCLDRCESGPSIVVYPEAIWYAGVTPEDADDIFREHILQGRPVERLIDREPDG